MRRHQRSAALLLSAAVAMMASLSCNDSPVTPPAAAPPSYPANDSPANTIARFIALYEARDAGEFEKLLTGDFRFEFSSAADPGFVILYPSGWVKDDERIATRNLFQGGMNMGGFAVEAAQTVQLSIAPTTSVGDTTGGKDSTRYQTLFAAIELRVEFASGDELVAGEAPPQFNRFFLVRGDAAVGLDAGQPGDSLHWYVYRWRDESPFLKPTAEPEQSEATTWGRIKGIYR